MKPLLWRSNEFNDLLKTLDIISEENKTLQGQRQKKQRIEGSASQRQKPQTDLPKRAICQLSRSEFDFVLSVYICIQYSVQTDPSFWLFIITFGFNFVDKKL